MSEAHAIHVAPGEGDFLANPLGGGLTLKLRGADTEGRMMAFESLIEPGEGPPLHLHLTDDEVWYVLEGTFRFTAGGEMQSAAAGSFVFIPRGVAHTWQNIGAEPGRLLVILTPAGLELFFERLADAPSGSSVAELFRTHGSEAGMEIVGPPLAESHPIERRTRNPRT
jgi:quercetin dioxygenase-like cupin family protein